jgi:hypothetical protein
MTFRDKQRGPWVRADWAGVRLFRNRVEAGVTAFRPFAGVAANITPKLRRRVLVFRSCENR